MNDVKTVTVSILDKDYQVNCRPDEVAALKKSASFLDEKMREIKSATSVLGLDRISVMAALNIANDLLLQSQRNEEITTSQTSEIQHLHGKLDQALTRLRSGAR